MVGEKLFQKINFKRSNAFLVGNGNNGSDALALALARNFIDKVHKGTCRVHGGGFKGTITCLIGLEHKDDFIAYMSKYFDPSYIYPMSIRRIGAIHI